MESNVNDKVLRVSKSLYCPNCQKFFTIYALLIVVYMAGWSGVCLQNFVIYEFYNERKYS